MPKLPLRLINDIDPEHKQALLDVIKRNTMFSVSYISLLVASTIICTLGLLIDSPATIIGGMIIAPLMWPLVKIAMGISLARKTYLLNTIYLLLGSLALILLTASVITLISPLKGLNEEILTRSQPTLLDLFIALAAGTVAALALIHKRISSSLAGVAIAASLLPPLCATGIGFALTNYSVAFGSFLLFTANAVSIIFVAIFVFRFAGLTNSIHKEFRNESILFVAIMLAITALPLFIYLREYSFKAEVFQTSEQVLERTFDELSEDIIINNISTNVSKEKDTIAISADILVPDGTSLSLEQKEVIIEELEESLQKKVKLNLLVQQTIALQSESNQATELNKKKLREEFINHIKELDDDYAINSITVQYNEEAQQWNMISVMRTNPNIVFTNTQREQIQAKLSEIVEVPVLLSIEIIPRIILHGEAHKENQDIEDEIVTYFSTLNPDIIIASLSISDRGKNKFVIIEIHSPQTFTLTNTKLNQLRNTIESKYDTAFELSVRDIKMKTYSL